MDYGLKIPSSAAQEPTYTDMDQKGHGVFLDAMGQPNGGSPPYGPMRTHAYPGPQTTDPAFAPRGHMANYQAFYQNGPFAANIGPYGSGPGGAFMNYGPGSPPREGKSEIAVELWIIYRNYGNYCPINHHRSVIMYL